MSLGEEISSLRKSKGISQELLAENSNISLRTIQRIETGATTPRPYTIKTLADALGIPVEQLSYVKVSSNELDQTAIAKLRLMNFSALAALLIPFSNILFTVLIWKENKAIPLINKEGRKIISFQIMWTLGTLLLVFIIPSIQYSIVHSYVIGRFPPTAIVVYIALLIVNLLFTIRTAIQLQKGKSELYSFVPTLF